MNTAWNFIDEIERRAELYQYFTPRQFHVLHELDDLLEVTRLLQADEELEHCAEHDVDIHALLRDSGISDSEIRWLERTGRIPPES